MVRIKILNGISTDFVKCFILEKSIKLITIKLLYNEMPFIY